MDTQRVIEIFIRRYNQQSNCAWDDPGCLAKSPAAEGSPC